MTNESFSKNRENRNQQKSASRLTSLLVLILILACQGKNAVPSEDGGHHLKGTCQATEQIHRVSPAVLI